MLVLLVKYTVMLCVITTVCYSVSIRRGIESAKQYLKSNGIPDVDMCTSQRISALCANATEGVVCAVRLVNKKMEFTQFESPCYLDLNNICESQDNIWVIKNFGPCIINPDLRRYANAIEKTADIQEESTNDDYIDYGGEIPAIKTEKNESVVAGTANTEVSNTTSTQGDNATISEDEHAPENTTDPVVDETETADEDSEDDTAVFKMANGEDLNFGDGEIGKIFDRDTGTVRSILRQASRFPPMRAKYVYNQKRSKIRCKNRVKPCPQIYLPVCLHYLKDVEDKFQYYYFINRCEGEQWSCYYPDKPINRSSSLRTNFCGHINYINYARYIHTISAWSHYGWLHGPGRYNHILKPHQRA